MRVTFVGHASLLVQARGVSILSDPWWRGPCFGAQWWTYPAPRPDCVGTRVDYIYVSHGHHDHLHPGTLRTLERSATCLVSARLDIAPTLAGLGFPVATLAEDEVRELAPGVSLRILPTHADDTLCVIDDGERVLVNLNDALHAAPRAVQDAFIERLRRDYPRIDYLFCGYGVASHFPNCYVIPGKDAVATAARRQAHFNRMWSRLVGGLKPRHAFPFAADVAFLEHDLIWANEPTHNAQRPVDVFRAEHPGTKTQVHDIAPGFVIEDDDIRVAAPRTKADLLRLSAECAEGIVRANRYGTGSREVVRDLVERLRANVVRCLPYLNELRTDWRFLVRFRGLETAIALEKRGRAVGVHAVEAPREADYDIVYITRLHYLRTSLTTPYGYEILFVGSGGVFRYARASDAHRNLHRELAILLVPHDTAPASRFGDNSPLMWRAKRALKRLTGRREEDLYDLSTWTVWQAPGTVG